VDAFSVDIQAAHFVAQICETGACDQTYITSTDYSDVFHSEFTFLSQARPRSARMSGLE
jgi:hypothetical protein